MKLTHFLASSGGGEVVSRLDYRFRPQVREVF